MFDSIYDVLSDMEKKQFYNTLLSEVQIFEEEQDKGQIIKSIGFQFPVFYDGKFTKQIIRDKEKTVETVCLLEFLQGVNWNSEHDKKRKVDIKVTCIENGVTQVRLVEKILL